ncbi:MULTISPECIES: iron-containing redox enzyme family protein [Prauserella salsuginis group]|uniref:Iron-containing redox enzyme family protein n=1 Tax=Prauserella salsuginis TaxID=387889 RepID=A0ABW6G067_9PSEU|nr:MULTISPECIES: iron-containing redox enzyme family protein [Prauserella salsuginis group]
MEDLVERVILGEGDVVRTMIRGSGGATELGWQLRRSAYELAQQADRDSDAFARLHRTLELMHSLYFTKPRPGEADINRRAIIDPAQAVLDDFAVGFEDQWIDSTRCPDTSDPDEFVRELKDQVRAHPANRHPFYVDFLPNTATVEHIRYYLAQETALDPRFDDFIALMQLGCDPQQKLELAGNYWDEMGNGDHTRVHTNMFSQAMHEVGATEEFVANNRLTETLVCGNLSAALAVNPRFYYRSIGSFAVTEFLFPRRCAQLLEAWNRNDLPAASGEYHREHIGVDARHASGFFRNVIKPELAKNPASGPDIYWGAMARMNSSHRYLDCLLTEVTR